MPLSSQPGPDAARVASLRGTLLNLTYRCPNGQYKVACPFKDLSGISHSSRQGLFEHLDEGQLVSLFDLLPTCSCPADVRRNPAAPTSTP